MDDPNITMEEYIRLEEETAQKHGKVFNWETAKYGKIWYNKDVHDLRSVETKFPTIVFNDNLTSNETLSCEPTSTRYFNDLNFFKDFENEFSAIVYNDTLTSKSDFSTEPTLCPQHIDEFNLKDETSFFECDKKEQNVLYFNDLFPINVIYHNDSKSDKDNDDDKINIKLSSGDLSIEPLPNVIKIDAQWSNKLFETSHDTSRMLINLIKNLYVPFGIPFNPKLFYKDGTKLGDLAIGKSTIWYTLEKTCVELVRSILKPRQHTLFAQELKLENHPEQHIRGVPRLILFPLFFIVSSIQQGRCII
ncbi:hypothetical protein Tco_0299484 [Tanacetum coccineum]